MHPVKSVMSPKTFAAGQAIASEKIIAQYLSTLLGFTLPLVVAVYSKDMYTAQSTQRNASNHAVSANINVMQYEFGTRNTDGMIWIPGKLNLADPTLHPDSTLNNDLCLLQVTGKVSFDFRRFESPSSDRHLG